MFDKPWLDTPYTVWHILIPSPPGHSSYSSGQNTHMAWQPFTAISDFWTELYSTSTEHLTSKLAQNVSKSNILLIGLCSWECLSHKIYCHVNCSTFSSPPSSWSLSAVYLLQTMASSVVHSICTLYLMLTLTFCQVQCLSLHLQFVMSSLRVQCQDWCCIHMVHPIDCSSQYIFLPFLLQRFVVILLSAYGCKNVDMLAMSIWTKTNTNTTNNLISAKF